MAATKKASAAKRLARKYTALHEGKAPASVRTVKVAAPPKELIELGRVSDVVYQKVTTEKGKPPSYHHEFESHARPLLSHDERGKLYISEGQYTVTSEGITDMKSRKRHGSKYRFGASRANTGRKHHGRGKSRRALAARSRRNPSDNGILGPKAMKWGESALRAVFAAGAYELVSGIALNHLPWLRDRSMTQRSMIQGGLAVALGFGTRTRYPNVALGFVVSGGVNIVEGGLSAASITHYLDNAFSRAVATLAPTVAAPNATTGAPAANTSDASSAPGQGPKLVGRGVNRNGLPDGARAGMPAGNRATVGAAC